MLYIFTGNGKGKTTAALGQATRAVGEGRRVLVTQFMKGPWTSGEDLFLQNFKIPDKKFKIVKKGKGFVGIMGDTLPRSEHEAAAREALEYAKKEIETGNWDIVILDEINNAILLHLISLESVLEFLQAVGHKLQALIFTGRGAPQELIDRADLVTEIRDIKHPYEKGIMGSRGIEY